MTAYPRGYAAPDVPLPFGNRGQATTEPRRRRHSDDGGEPFGCSRGFDPIDSIVTPATSNVFIGSAPQTISLAQVFTPAGNHWHGNGVHRFESPTHPEITPLPPLVLQERVAVSGGPPATIRATCDPTLFADGVTEIAMRFQWQHDFRCERCSRGEFTDSTTDARVARLPDLTTISVITPIQAQGARFGFRPRVRGTPVDSVDARIAWGDGSVTRRQLPVVGCEARVAAGLHDHEEPGRYDLTRSSMLAGQTYGLSTVIDVPAPPSLLLPAVGFAGLGCARRVRRNTRNTRATRR